MIAKYAK